MCPHTQTHTHAHTFIQPSMTNTHGTRQKEPVRSSLNNLTLLERLALLAVLTVILLLTLMR